MERALSIVEQLKLLNSLVFKPLKEEQSDYPIVPVGELVRHVLFVVSIFALLPAPLSLAPFFLSLIILSFSILFSFFYLTI